MLTVLTKYTHTRGSKEEYLLSIHAQFLHNIDMSMVSMSGTNWTAAAAAAAAAANNNDAGYGYYDEDMPPANDNENAQPLRSTSRPININPRIQHQTSSPVNVNHFNLPPALPRFNSWMMTSDGRRAHPSVPMNVFVPAVPRLQPQPHQVHEHATHVQPMRNQNQMIIPSPNFDMAYDVGFEQHFSAPVYQHPPIPTIHPPYAHGSSSPSLERSPKGKVLFVHNLPSEVMEDELRDLFSSFGTVARVSIGRSIAFVYFRQQSEADEARLGLNEHRVSKIFGFIIITCIYLNVNIIIILTVTLVCFSDSQQHLAR